MNWEKERERSRWAHILCIIFFSSMAPDDWLHKFKYAMALMSSKYIYINRERRKMLIHNTSPSRWNGVASENLLGRTSCLLDCVGGINLSFGKILFLARENRGMQVNGPMLHLFTHNSESVTVSSDIQHHIILDSNDMSDAVDERRRQRRQRRRQRT